MKKYTRLLALLLALLMVTLSACTPSQTDPTQGSGGEETTVPETTGSSASYEEVAGMYCLDATPLGMPMQWYIHISADGSFLISTDMEGQATKGAGTVGSKDGTYMLVYEDSTADTPKTATFTLEGVNLSFSTAVPVGTASVAPQDDTPIVAKKIAYPEYLGTYMGTFEKEAMGSAITYTFTLELGYGAEYTFESTVVMQDTPMTRTESGTFQIEGDAITFTPAEGEAVTGSVADGSITAAFLLSEMASEPQEVTAEFAVYAQEAGTYTGAVSIMDGMAVYNTSLTLDPFGAYTYTTVDPASGEEQFRQEGTYTAQDGVITFTPAEGEAVEGTITDYTVTADFQVNAMVPNATTLTFLSPAIQGTFQAAAEEESYYAKLELAPDYTFVLTFATDEAMETISYVATGTFALEGMGMSLTTEAVYSSAEMTEDTQIADAAALLGTPITVVLSDTGLNANLPYDVYDTATVGFVLTH